MSANVAIVGSRNVVMPFLATGARVEFVEKSDQALDKVEELINDGQTIIFFTDDLTEPLWPIIDRYRDKPVPCLVPIPAGRGEVSKGTLRIQRVIKKAVGIDILKED